jgi:hypothetical protein
MIFVVDEVPHTLVTVYLMVSMPGVTPVTNPPDTVAFELLALQVPPVVASVSMVKVPAHTLEAPTMGATPAATTLTVYVAATAPQVFDTV